MSERGPIDMEQYMDGLEPLHHDPAEEDTWQEHYQYVVDNADMFSEDYVEWNRRQLHVIPRYRRNT